MGEAIKIIKYPDAIEGEFYRYGFDYGDKRGTAIVQWFKDKAIPWLGLHEDVKYIKNDPSTDMNTDFTPASKEDIIWIKACMKADKFVTKEEALTKNFLRFTVGDRVKLNRLGKFHWDFQTNDDEKGTIERIEYMNWDGHNGDFKGSKLCITVKWDISDENDYPEDGLYLVFGLKIPNKNPIFLEPVEIIICDKTKYFVEEKEDSLLDLIGKI